MGVQWVASVDVWSWYAVPNAASQFRTTRHSDWVEPRSTCSHCGSEAALDQRVVVLPPTALDGGKATFSCEEVVAVLPCAMSVLPQPVVPPPLVAVCTPSSQIE